MESVKQDQRSFPLSILIIGRSSIGEAERKLGVDGPWALKRRPMGHPGGCPLVRSPLGGPDSGVTRLATSAQAFSPAWKLVASDEQWPRYLIRD